MLCVESRELSVFGFDDYKHYSRRIGNMTAFEPELIDTKVTGQVTALDINVVSFIVSFGTTESSGLLEK